VDGKSSHTAPVRTVVPHGSVLGPLMFLLFINDLPDYVQSSTVRLFADDSVLYRKIQNEADSKLLQEDMKIYSDGNLTGKWSFIPVNASFYVLPTNVNHLPQAMTYMDINWN